MPLFHPVRSTIHYTNSPESKAVTLGIDFGSTSTRAVLWCPEDNEEYSVESESPAAESLRFARGEFPSVGYPFDGGKVYLGKDSDASRKSISLKYAFYILAHAPDELVSQYQLSKPLRDHQGEKDFRERLDKGIRDLFISVYRRVLKVCRQEELQVTTIGLSIPSQWTMEFMDLYRGIIADVFEHHPKDIFFVTEVEALAHYLCAKKMKRLVQHHNAVHNTVVVVLDFGGHTMNTCTINIVYDPGSLPAFYLIGDPKGASGGSELWESLLADMSLKQAQDTYGFVPSDADKQVLLDSINKSKKEWGVDCDNKGFECVVVNGRTRYPVDLDEECVTDCFDEAMQGPLALAATRIAEATRTLQSQDQNEPLDNIQGPEPAQKPRVILAGGTASNKGLERIIETICYSNGLDCPVKTCDISIRYDSAKIASGAAFAVASPLTVEQFMKQGAAFGLQMRQGAAEPDRRWDSTAEFLYSMRRSRTIKILVKGNDDLKIVCDPFFDKDEDNTKETLYYDRCYDFIDLGRPARGSWWFSLALDGHGDQMRLTIRRSRMYGKAKNPTQYAPITLALHYDRGSNSIHPGRESCDLGRDRDVLALSQYAEHALARQEQTSPPVAPLKTTKRPTARRGKSRKMVVLSGRSDRGARTLDGRGRLPLHEPGARQGVRRLGSDDGSDTECGFWA